MSSSTKPIRIAFTGGGSGGHIFPLFAVSESINQMNASLNLPIEFYFLGPVDQYVEEINAHGMRLYPITASKLRRYFSLLNIFTPFLFFFGLCQALIKLFWIMPDVVFSKGGSGALPVVLVSWFYRIPVIIHDSDAIPGTTNIISGRFAKIAAVSFERALRYFSPSKAAWTGGPVRPSLLEEVPNQRDAKITLGFDPEAPLAVILAGSQGSQRINTFILTNLADVLKEVQLLHQTGASNFAEVKQLSRAALIDIPIATAAKARYQAVPFIDDDLKIALSAADVIIGRASSGVMFEAAAFGKPMILIPLEESASDHQRANAYEFAKTGGGIVIEEGNLLPGIFLNQLRDILHNPKTKEEMSQASRSFYKQDAASSIAEEILNITRGIG